MGSGGFAFNFSGDDIDYDADLDLGATAAAAAGMASVSATATTMAAAGAMDVDDNNKIINHRNTLFTSHTDAPSAVQNHVLVKEENVTELLDSLPARIPYNSVHVPYRTASSSDDGGDHTTPRFSRTLRRALFDVRMQLMSEDESLSSHAGSGGSYGTSGAVAGLSDSDIERNIYEGGFKTWESALDIASHLLSHREMYMANMQSVIELGCGTALPSLQLFRAAVQHRRPLELVLCDYNSSVLRLVTLPNLFLVWAAARAEEDDEKEDAMRMGEIEEEDQQRWWQHDDGDLEVTPELLAQFLADLKQCGIKIRLISGPWSPDLVAAITSLRQQRADDSVDGHFSSDRDVGESSSAGRLIMAAETIYSPHTLPLFTGTFLSLLSSSTSSTQPRSLQTAQTGAAVVNRGLVGAKRVYFGVGGGVDEFLSQLHEKSAALLADSIHHEKAPSSSLAKSTSRSSSMLNVEQHEPITFSQEYQYFSSAATTLASAHLASSTSPAAAAAAASVTVTGEDAAGDEGVRSSSAGSRNISSGADDSSNSNIGGGGRSSGRGIARCLLELSLL